MNTYGFTVAHGYEILKGYVKADSIEDAKKKILNEEWEDIIDEYDIDDFVEDYEIDEIWE